MAKLHYNEITAKKTVIMDGDPYMVLSSAIAKKDRQKASNTVKMKNLKTGSVVDRTFHQADVLEAAELDKKEIRYIYNHRGVYVFSDPQDPSNRFTFESDVIGDNGKWLKENSIVEALMFDGETISISIPIKVDLKVAEAAPAVKGNTSSGATKEVTLETGAVVLVPLFINRGDTVRVNTETGEYAERVEKAQISA